ncbi:hypothetical protein [Maritimibacter sp. HL-12]|jgi:hypothetical protein|uniref:hypothetical protein n=1 Tax=Maritimibacter sp. HL-12 TaxID=1162418 RepID=UPI000A0F0D48|nr:hypothetical protein [Maritimibacter sp. HL-12]SMH57282.1 hypothetical protein SAMN05661107_3387 [Maritimibacter sp. HL-12]
MDIHTLSQLLMAPADPARAREIGQMGYMQWLAGLPGGACYAAEARRALCAAQPFAASDPAVAEVCRVLRASLGGPTVALGLALPAPRRRGGAGERRRAL